MYTIYTTSTSIEYVHWHKDGNHGMDIESNMDLKYLLKQKKIEDEKIKKNYYHPYKQKLPSKSITDLVIDKLKKDTKNYEKQKSIIDKTVPNINHPHLQHHHYGTSLIITHDKYTSIINGKKKTDEDGIIEAKEYDDDDDVQNLKFDKHPYGLFSFPFTIFDKLGFGGLF
uniref:ATS domain-containing protein n=1 Tax=Schistosoma mansoni TaxID=6183 RepID=A0A5K4F5Z4_SCHMA